jgi:DNA-binding CsgD family transcriptional regulator
LKERAEVQQSDASVAANVAASFLRARRWDEAFSLIEELRLYTLLDELITEALPEMVQSGRIATLKRWAVFGRKAPHARPLIDLVKAELALRDAAYEAAETLALSASRELPLEHALLPKALMAAGKAAHLADGEQRGFDFYSRARQAALSQDDRREALWGQLICANQLDLPIVDELVDELSATPARSADDALRLATMQYVVGLRSHGISATLPVLRAAHTLVTDAVDPLARTSFLNIFARGLALSGFYEDSATIGEELLVEARRGGLAFVVPHALVGLAMAELGARRPAAAVRYLDEADKLAMAGSDVHNQFDSQAVRCRVFISKRNFQAALDATAVHPGAAGATARREFLASRALALLGAERSSEALTLASEVRDAEGQSSRSHEVRGLVAWIRAIERLQRDDPSEAGTALAHCAQAGAIDSFVVAYRGFPAILSAIAADPFARDIAVGAMARVGDSRLAYDTGLAEEPHDKRLSKREREVFELLAAGRSNRDIADALFISEVTVKVHVRHILEKLGAKSRTEAAVLGSTAPLP